MNKTRRYVRVNIGKQKCSKCAWISPVKLTLIDRVFQCADCDLVIDRDINAASNILKAGTDQTFSPSFIDDVSMATDFLIEKRVSGIFHAACRSCTTPFEFASFLISKVFETPEVETGLQRSHMADSNLLADKAPRPLKGGLRIEKIVSLGFTPRSTQEALGDMARQMKARTGDGFS